MSVICLIRVHPYPSDKSSSIPVLTNKAFATMCVPYLIKASKILYAPSHTEKQKIIAGKSNAPPVIFIYVVPCPILSMFLQLKISP